MLDSKENIERQREAKLFIEHIGLDMSSDKNTVQSQQKIGALLSLIDTQINFIEKLNNPLFDQFTIISCYTEQYHRQQQLFTDIYEEDITAVYFPNLIESEKSPQIESLFNPIEIDGFNTNLTTPEPRPESSVRFIPIRSTSPESGLNSALDTPQLTTKAKRGNYIKNWPDLLKNCHSVQQYVNNTKLMELFRKEESKETLTSPEKSRLQRYKSQIKAMLTEDERAKYYCRGKSKSLHKTSSIEAVANPSTFFMQPVNVFQRLPMLDRQIIGLISIPQLIVSKNKF